MPPWRTDSWKCCCERSNTTDGADAAPNAPTGPIRAGHRSTCAAVRSRETTEFDCAGTRYPTGWTTTELRHRSHETMGTT
ncbi:hypothetical protein GS506_02725 [Rhodococcus hoagii]|nr:hypothetical protein [Prescottella equi]